MSQNKSFESEKSKAYNHVLKYTGLFGGVQGITVLLSVVRNKFVAVLLDTVGMACTDIYNHAMTLLSGSTQLGIPMTAVRTLSELYGQGDRRALEEHVRMIRSWSLLTALVGTFACLCLAVLLGRWGFHDDSHFLQFLMLSPVVGMLAITGVEIAILKAMRQLRSLAWATSLGALSTLLLTVPLYWLFGIGGIVPAMLLSTLGVMLINMCFSLRLFRWKASPFSWSVLRQGKSMIQLGISFTLAGIVAAAAEMAVRSFIVDKGSLADEGLYCSGFILTVSYARFVLVSMDADYYPRLSSICHDVRQMNLTINRQLEVCVLLIAPFLILFALFLPFIVHLLFKESFLAAVPMTLCAIFYMFFKAIVTPVAYTSLAKGDSVLYFVMETLYYLLFLILIMVGYSRFGLLGCGVALSLSNFVELLMIASVFHWRYHFSFARRSLLLCLVQALLLVGALWLAWQSDALLKYGLGIPLMLLSLGFSLFILNKETSLLQRLKARFSR